MTSGLERSTVERVNCSVAFHREEQLRQLRCGRGHAGDSLDSNFRETLASMEHAIQLVSVV